MKHARPNSAENVPFRSRCGCGHPHADPSTFCASAMSASACFRSCIRDSTHTWGSGAPRRCVSGALHLWGSGAPSGKFHGAGPQGFLATRRTPGAHAAAEERSAPPQPRERRRQRQGTPSHPPSRPSTTLVSRWRLDRPDPGEPQERGAPLHAAAVQAGHAGVQRRPHPRLRLVQLLAEPLRGAVQVGAVLGGAPLALPLRALRAHLERRPDAGPVGVGHGHLLLKREGGLLRGALGLRILTKRSIGPRPRDRKRH